MGWKANTAGEQARRTGGLGWGGVVGGGGRRWTKAGGAPACRVRGMPHPDGHRLSAQTLATAGAAQAVMAVLAQDPAALSRAFQREPLAAREGVAAALTSLRVRTLASACVQPKCMHACTHARMHACTHARMGSLGIRRACWCQRVWAAECRRASPAISSAGCFQFVSRSAARPPSKS
jgi:hypothetical protein